MQVSINVLPGNLQSVYGFAIKSDKTFLTLSKFIDTQTLFSTRGMSLKIHHECVSDNLDIFFTILTIAECTIFKLKSLIMM